MEYYNNQTINWEILDTITTLGWNEIIINKITSKIRVRPTPYTSENESLVSEIKAFGYAQ